jgi:PKD repeat protein
MRARRSLIGLVLTLLPIAVEMSGALQPAHAGPPTGGHPTAYAIARAGNTAEVDVIDTTSHTLVSTISLASDASALAITPDARFALVVLTGNLLGGSQFGPALPGQIPPSPEVVAIDTSTNKLVAGAVAPLAGQPPVSLAISPDGSSAFVIKTFGFCGTGCNPTGTVMPITIGAGAALAARPPFLLPNSDFPVDAAVSTDGRTLYVLTSNGLLDGFALPGLGLTSATAIPTSANHLVLSPDGKTAYLSIAAAQFGYPPPGYILPVALGAKPAPGTPISLLGASGSSAADPGTLAIATTPAGQSILYVGDTANFRVVGIPIPGGAPSPLSLNQVDDNARSLFGTPDGSTVEMTTPGRNITVNITGAANSPGAALGTCFSVTPLTCPPGSGAIAVTPDQRPVASFVATPAGPGQPASFDASDSTIVYGTIANYHWDFGDGSSQDTASPTTTHPYATAGSYTVSLTETDWAGTSVSTSPPSTVFTGQTMTRRGGPEAQTTRRVTIPRIPTTPLPSVTSTFRPPPGSPAPKISLLPKVGPPGTVVAVSGSDFPASTPVTLVWQPGIGTAAVTTSPTGTFTNRFVLVLPKDQLGDRLMVAQTFGATATFLVVPPSISPGGHGAELSLLYRR